MRPSVLSYLSLLSLVSLTTPIPVPDGLPLFSFTGRAPDPTTIPNASSSWNDPWGSVPLGSWTFVLWEGQLDIFTQAVPGPLAPDTGFFAISRDLCAMAATVTLTDPNGNRNDGWVDTHAEGITYEKFYVHPGNQCGGWTTSGEQFDNTWTLRQDHKWFLNLPNAAQCQDLGDWGISRARRCVLKIHP